MKKLVLHLVLLAAAVTFIYPFLWMAAVSVKPAAEAASLSLWSAHPTLASYSAIFRQIPIGRALCNSLVVASTTTASVLFFCSLAGYALAKLRFRGRETLFLVILLTMMIPGQLTLIPLYTLIVKLGWTDSYAGLIAPGMISGLGVLIFRQTFISIPDELMEAARMEGCGELGILARIFWPLAKPAMVTVGIITFMNSWNEVLWPMMVVRDQQMMTMPQMITMFSVGGQAGGEIGVELAASMLLVLPIVLAYSFFQRYFIEGIATTGIKG
ncbi:MAG: carbohydrate ABC transporter permease [Elusimicrobiota bacterium]|jgi:multiple sugar transport system permease protein